MLNKQTGNMYPWCNFTWNPIRGKCPHQCSYCYMKRFKVGELRLDKKCLKDRLGADRTIFVGSSTDMWAKEVPKEWIIEVLEACNSFPYNTYPFQSKNPKRFYEFLKLLPPKTILGTTIETDRPYGVKTVPSPEKRRRWMMIIGKRKFVSIEPIIDFNLNGLVSWMRDIEPEFVSIGADSQGHNLPEPSPEKVHMIIKELEKFTKVKVKDNLDRILRI